MTTLTSKYAIPIGTLAVGLGLIGAFLRFQSARKRPAWVNELADLGIPSKTKIAGTAVICGGSIAGMMTARITADHFEKVVVVDPEFTKVLEGKGKTRVLQYTSLHLFLTFLLDGLRRLWPDFDAEAVAAGGLPCEADLNGHYSGFLIPAPYKDYAPGPLPKTINLRRPKFEQLLQKLLLAHPTSDNISVVDGIVRKLDKSSDGKSIESVVVRGSDGQEVILRDVALLIDCTGATQAGIKWLKSAGYGLPDDLRLSYNPKMQYMTITFEITSEFGETLPIPSGYSKSSWMYGFQSHYEIADVGLALTRMDNDTVQLIFGGWGRYDLPKESSEIEPFIAGIKSHKPIPDWVHKTIRSLIDHGLPSFEAAKIPALSYVRYETVTDLPANFIAIGDSAMQLNPIYGQGCTKALLGGLSLNSILKSHDHKLPLSKDFSLRYFKTVAPRMKALWDGTKPIDYGFSSTEPVVGETLEDGKYLRWFSSKMISSAIKDEEVASAVWHVRHLLASESDLLSPRILWKIVTTSSIFGS